MTARPCLSCGCLIPSGSRCEPCTAALPPSARRPRPARPRAWRRLSLRARALQPFCEDCGTEDDLSADHLVPLSLGGAMVPGLDGVAVVCRPCNAKRYAAQKAAHETRGEAPGVDSLANPRPRPEAGYTPGPQVPS